MKKLIAFVAVSFFFVGVASAQVENTSTTSEKKTECTKSKECCKAGATQGAEKKECTGAHTEGKSECCSKGAAADAKKGKKKGKECCSKEGAEKCEHKDGDHKEGCKGGEHKEGCKEGEKKDCCKKAGEK